MLDAAPPPLAEAVDQKRLVIPPPVVPAEAVQQSVVVGDGVILDRRRAARFGVRVVGGEGSAQRMIMLSFDTMLGCSRSNVGVREPGNVCISTQVSGS